MNRVLVYYHEYFGRLGNLDAIFVCTENQYEKILNVRQLYLYEALGKHTEVFADIGSNITTILKETPETKEVFDKLSSVFVGPVDSIMEAIEEEGE